MPIRRSLYLDTNGFIYAYFYISRPSQAESLNLTYYTKGKNTLNALEFCRENNVRVFSTDITFLEMIHNYYEWKKLCNLLEAGAPPGLIFGKNQRMDSDFLKQRLPREEQQQIIIDSENFLNVWGFQDLVEFQPPEKILYWFEIAKFINSYIHATVIDSLHLAAAISLECDYLLTEDDNLREVITSLRNDTECKNEIKRKFNLSEDYNLPDAVKAATFINNRFH